jgi:hypothetical protein
VSVVEIITVEVVVETVVVVLVPEVKLYRIEADHYERSPAFLTFCEVALLDLGIDINFFVTFGANRGWHR